VKHFCIALFIVSEIVLILATTEELGAGSIGVNSDFPGYKMNESRRFKFQNGTARSFCCAVVIVEMARGGPIGSSITV